MRSHQPSSKFTEALRWLLSESGQSFTLESSASTFIRSCAGADWCVGTISLDGNISEEVTYNVVDEATSEYVSRMTMLNNW